MAAAGRLEQLLVDLKSDKVKSRKEALKQLTSFLDSDALLRALDAGTAALPPGAAITAASWPGLAVALIKHIEAELARSAAGKKGPEPALSRAFRLLTARAEEGERRSGHARMLLRAAARLFKHVTGVLKTVGLTSPMGLDYSHVLRNQLLPVPEYCACSSAHAFQDLIDVHTAFLEKHPLERGLDEAQRALATLTSLLAACPGDLQPMFQADLVDFFAELAGRLEGLSQTSPSTAARLLPPTLTAVNTFLLGNGRDCAARVAGLHSALHALVLGGLGAKDGRLREAAATYLRCQLQLGSLPAGSAELQDVQDWVERELEAPALKWGEDSREGRLLLGRQQAALLDLAAAAHFQSSGAGGEAGGGGGDSDFEAEALPARKRRRVAPLLAGLSSKLAGRPAVWAPVLSRLLLGYGLALPAEAYADWLRQLAALAPTHFPEHFMPDEHDADAALWLLRLAHALALAWPLHLAASDAGRGSSQEEGLPSPAVVQEQWGAIWSAVLGYAKSANVPAASFPAALAVLTTLAQRRLVQLLPGFHKLWGLPLLDQLPTQAGLEFVAAAVAAGQDAAVDSALWQPSMLQWLRAAASSAAPSSIVAAAAAVLRMVAGPATAEDGAAACGGSGGCGSGGSDASDDTPSLGRLPSGADLWWQWWQKDAALSTRVAALIRGELLMRARALGLQQQQAEAAAAASRQRPQQAEAAAAASRQRPQQAASMLAPPSLQEQACEVLLDRLEDVVRQPPSPATGSLSAQQNSRLAQLLATATAAVELSTRAMGACAAAGRPLPPCWSPAGALAAKLQLALQQCGNQLAEACKRLEGFYPAEEQGLRQLAAALHAYQRASGSSELADSLLRCMPQVQDLFLHAAAVVPEVVATQAAVATRGLAAATGAAAEWLDDDLDVGGRAPTVARAGSTLPATAGVSTSASLVSACKMRCATLLLLLGPLRPADGVAAAQHWLDAAQQPGQFTLPEEAHLALIDTMVQCCLRAMPSAPAEAAQHGLAACTRLDVEHSGVLAWPPKHHNGRCLFAAQRARQMVEAAAAAHAADPEAAPVLRELLGALVFILDDCLVNLAEAEEKAGDKLSGWRLRVALAEGAAAVMRTDPKLMSPEVLEAALSCISGLLADDSYAARLAGGRLVQVLLERYSNPHAVFDNLKASLTLHSTGVREEADNKAQLMETSLFMLAESAARCAEVELHCVFLLCGHAASAPGDLPLVAATLDWVAARLHYPHRHAYAAWHQRALLYHWVSAGYTLQHWMAVQRLVAPSREAAAGDTRTFLAACAPALVSTIVYGERSEDLGLLGTALNKEPAELISEHYDLLMALAWPMVQTGREEDKRFAIDRLAHGVVGTLLSTEDVNRLMGRTPVEHIAQMLLLARPGGEGGAPPPRPWFLPALLVASAYSLCSKSSLEENRRVLWDKVLSHDAVARLLLVVHQQLERARHPRHQAQALTPLQAALDLLEGHVCEAATFRYTASILLRLLPVRELQEQCCGMLASVVSLMLRQRSAAELEPLGAMLPALLSTLAEGIEAEHSAGRSLDTPAVQAMLRLVGQLTTGAPQPLRTFLQQVDPLPDGLPLLEQPAALVAEARQHITPCEQLTQFAGRASSMTPALRHRSLAALRRVLTAQQAALFVAASPGVGSEAVGGATVCLPEVAAAAWRLAVLSSELADAELAEFAGELLALAGPLDPSAIAFDPAAAFSSAAPSPGAAPGAASGSSGSGGRTQGGGTQTPAATQGGRSARPGRRTQSSPGGRGGNGSSGSGGTWAAALALLADYLVDESVEVIRTAQYTLRLLLATAEGQEALQQLDPALRPYLEAFRHDSREAGAHRPVAAAAAQAASAGAAAEGASPGGRRLQLDSRQLWRCDGRRYDDWVCQLACAMLHKARGATLASCQRMAQRKPAFAELLLPHAFADLAVQADSGSLSLQLGSLISQQLLPRLHRHPKAARLILSCLNHLRSLFLDAKVAGSSGSSGGGSKGRKGKADGDAAALNAEIELWRKVYWVDADYLEVAAAAARCGAHFTALLYIEAWQEEQHGWLVPLDASRVPTATALLPGSGSAGSEGPSGAGGGGQGDGRAEEQAAALERVRRLLLDTYSAINEPDGIYAVARSHSMLSQLKRFEHEGDWSRALLSYDLVLQHLLGGPAGGGPSSGTQRQQQQVTSQLVGTDASGAFGSQFPAASQPAGGQPARSAAAASFEGISQQAAVAGLLRSLAQLGAGHLLQAYARSPEVPEAAAQAALSLGQWGQLGSSLTSGSSGSQPSDGLSLDAALSAAVAGLQAGIMERCKQAVSGARRGLVASLVTASLEGAANVNPSLVQLQMLQAVSEAWELLWPALPDLGSIGSPKKRRRRPASSDSTAAAAAVAVAAAAGGGPSPLLDGVLQLWQGREAAAGAGGRYDLQAPLQGMHQQLLAVLGAPDKQASSLVRAAVSARKTDHYAHATTSLYKLRGLLQAAAGGVDAAAPAWALAMSAQDASWRVEEAKLLWAQGQQDTAVQLARSLLAARGPAPQAGDGMQHAYLRSLTAKWLSRTRSDSPSTVLSLMQEAAQEAEGAAGSVQDGATACRVLYRLAHYADGLYRNIEAQKASPEYQTQKLVIEAKRRQIEVWAATLAARQKSGEAKIDRKGNLLDKESRMLAYYINSTRKPVEMDEAEQRLLDEKERQFLRVALSNYTRCLCTGDGYDLRVVFRIVQLWLRLGSDAEVNQLIGRAFREVPSYKFLPLVYQVASRMSAAKLGALAESGFQANLSALLVRLGVEHPHHSLYQIFSLKNGNRGKDGKVASGKAIEAFSYAADPDKVAAAQEVLDRVAAASPGARAVVREMGELIDGYIELAAVPPPTKDAEEMAFPSGLRRSRQNYTHVPVTSVSLPVDPSGHYEGFAHFVSFAERIKFVGGINKPKIVTVTDSEGATHRQLVKSGNDDLRQDAVMQQFFWLVNQFLAEQPRTQRRALFIRTYKVVPFSPSSGLLEWVENTLPIADYLLGPNRTSGAHMRYKRPGDFSWVNCYQELAKVVQAGQGGQAALRKAFDGVCARFPPVMHHFFLESFRDPGTWFERRLAYTRSMAVNSMAGHIIGLGDRHLQNILLDTHTANAVHIDLGIAFEQGRFLNTPELVPFRLTRDIVDGFGLAGLEGVMRRCCEETLRVLRANKESILTVIEVFIHDPLYKWALTTTAANRRQHDGGAADEVDDGSGEACGAGAAGAGAGVNLANADAERTLLRIKQKLEGVEAGEGEARGVEGQVQQLLQDAQNPDSLCRMYIGWQPWV